jgi:hypothetical protein
MTYLVKRKSRLIFTTADTVRYKGREREIVIEVSPFIATCRLAGTRTRYEMSWSGIFQHAARVYADRLRAERKAKKKGASR